MSELKKTRSGGGGGEAAAAAAGGSKSRGEALHSARIQWDASMCDVEMIKYRLESYESQALQLLNNAKEHLEAATAMKKQLRIAEARASYLESKYTKAKMQLVIDISDIDDETLLKAIEAAEGFKAYKAWTPEGPFPPLEVSPTAPTAPVPAGGAPEAPEGISFEID